MQAQQLKKVRHNLSKKWPLKNTDSDKNLALLINRLVYLVVSSLKKHIVSDVYVINSLNLQTASAFVQLCTIYLATPLPSRRHSALIELKMKRNSFTIPSASFL